MARGDLILFKASGNWYQKWITFATHGPYVHVEIDTGDGMVGAHTKAIEFTANEQVKDTREHVILSVHSTEPDGIEKGIAWLTKQVGKKYGWVDIISNALKFMGFPVYIGEKDHWDCSDLATRYLIHADAASPLGDLANDPGLVSPNDLGRAFLSPKDG